VAVALKVIGKVKETLQNALRELDELEKTIKETGHEVLSLVELEAKLGDLAMLVNVHQSGQTVVVKPKRFLGTEAFRRIAAVLKPLGFTYVSDGRNSRWEKPQTSKNGDAHTPFSSSFEAYRNAPVKHSKHEEDVLP
jgi:hypothetical protein